MISENLLCGKRVRLSALSHQDGETMAGWQQDAGLLRLWDAEPALPRSEDDVHRWIEDGRNKSGLIRLAIRPLEGNEILGVMELDGILWAHQVAWLGIGIGDRANWGKGLGREAIELALRLAFDELNLHRIQASVFSYNERSQALLAKAGFQREGVYREFMQRDGVRHDMYLYGLLRPEWVARRQAAAQAEAASGSDTPQAITAPADLAAGNERS